ncbi:MAG: type II toxin-antitoxin system PemK/MazF family toxin [Clostridia bacterium]|nr:type II toxin-antitoxin system PemK/MazF family toxin [Clostridia bacterium]
MIMNNNNNNEVKKGDIFFADLSPSIGSEQSGTRPVLIVQNNIGNKFSPTVIAAAITSHHKNDLPTHITIKSKECQGLKKDSVVLLEQIRTLDKRRLRFKLGSINQNLINQVDKALTVSLGLTL